MKFAVVLLLAACPSWAQERIGQPVNITQINGVRISTGTGAADSGTQRVALASGASATVTQGTGTWRVSGSVSISTVSSANVSSVSASATSVTILASNSSRQGALIYNDSPNPLLIKYGSSASATSFTTAITASSLFILPMPVYSGIITGLWTAAVGSARVTELQ